MYSKAEPSQVLKVLLEWQLIGHYMPTMVVMQLRPARLQTINSVGTYFKLNMPVITSSKYKMPANLPLVFKFICDPLLLQYIIKAV